MRSSVSSVALLATALTVGACGSGGGGSGMVAGGPTGQTGAGPGGESDRARPDDPPAAAAVRELMEELARAVQAADLSALRALADPETGAWFWADPGTASVPCTWVDAMGEEDPFSPDSQRCSPEPLLSFYADVLSQAVPVAGVDLPPDTPTPGQQPFGSIDTSADLAWLRIMAEEAGASSRVQRTIGGPLRHAFRGVAGGRGVTVYFSERVGTLFIAHVIAWRAAP